VIRVAFRFAEGPKLPDVGILAQRGKGETPAIA